MKLLKECSNKHIYPWIHYTINNYFDESFLASVTQLFDELAFVDSNDDFREECVLNYQLNNSTANTILNNFLQIENINFLNSLDQRIEKSNRLLRVSLWKDYKGFCLPIHTDSQFKLFTMQIYLPGNEEKDYGTTIYDQEGNFIKKTNYVLNDGYFFFPNIHKIKTNHSFVEPIINERRSLIFNIFDKDFYTKNFQIKFKKIFLSSIEF